MKAPRTLIIVVLAVASCIGQDDKTPNVNCTCVFPLPGSEEWKDAMSLTNVQPSESVAAQEQEVNDVPDGGEDCEEVPLQVSDQPQVDQEQQTQPAVPASNPAPTAKKGKKVSDAQIEKAAQKIEKGGEFVMGQGSGGMGFRGTGITYNWWEL